MVFGVSRSRVSCDLKAQENIPILAWEIIPSIVILSGLSLSQPKSTRHYYLLGDYKAGRMFLRNSS
jgi:hypothetical protein